MLSNKTLAGHSFQAKIGVGDKKRRLLNRSPRFLQYSWEEPRLHFSPDSRQTAPDGTGNCVPVTRTLEKNVNTLPRKGHLICTLGSPAQPPSSACPSCQICLFNTTFILSFFHGSHHVHLARGICCCRCCLASEV